MNLFQFCPEFGINTKVYLGGMHSTRVPYTLASQTHSPKAYQS
jgi:hypothetical protein